MRLILWFVKILALGLQLTACQSLQSRAPGELALKHVTPSASSTVGLPSCSGVLLTPKIVLTRNNCLSILAQKAYVVLGQERDKPVRKLVQIAQTRSLNADLGLLVLQEPAPKPYGPVQLAITPPPVNVGQGVWYSTYAPEGDLQSFGQVTQKFSQIQRTEGPFLFVEGPCVAEGSPLVVRQNAQWQLVGLAPNKAECERRGGLAMFQSVELTRDQILAEVQESRPKESGPADSFRLLREIRVDVAPFQADVAFSKQEKAKTCEYSLRVVRHNSYFETRYDLKSQAINPSEQAKVRLIFEDIYASLSSLIGRVKHVEIGSANCRSA